MGDRNEILDKQIEELNSRLHDENAYVIFVTEKSLLTSMYDVLLNDLKQIDNYQNIVEKNMKDKKWFSYLQSNKAHKFSFGMVDYIAEIFFLLPKIMRNNSKKFSKQIIIITNPVFFHSRYSKEMMRHLKKQYNCEFVLFYVDNTWKFCSYDANIVREDNAFNQIYSFDSIDAGECSMLFHHTPYSKINLKCTTEYDLFYCGVGTDDRYEIIKEIAINCLQRKLKLKANLANTELKTTCITNEFMDYKQTLEETGKSKCIIELVADGQSGATLRTYEAVCYNKRLLTNNRNIIYFKYYNPNYMKYFEKVEDIDWEWVKSEIDVDYHYSGDFSPIYLIKRIIEETQNK